MTSEMLLGTATTQSTSTRDEHWPAEVCNLSELRSHCFHDTRFDATVPAEQTMYAVEVGWRITNTEFGVCRPA
jgi:hypothetical protein